MFDSQILDVFIGLIFVYLLISLVCTSIKEGLETWLKTRASYLEYGIRELLHDRKGTLLAEKVFNSPYVYSLFHGEYKIGKESTPGLFSGGGNLPSYIPASSFAKALFDVLAHGPDQKNQIESIGTVVDLSVLRNNVSNIPVPQVQRVLLSAIDSAQGDINRAQKNVEDWFNSGMERVSGWYRRSSYKMVFFISLAVTVGLNVNTLTIAHSLYVNNVARDALVHIAEKAQKDGQSSSEAADVQLQKLDLPIGWNSDAVKSISSEKTTKQNLWAAYEMILGWLITAFAASLGAPFWFDVLNKVMSVRSTAKPTSSGTASEPATPVVSVSTPLNMGVISSQALPAQTVNLAVEENDVDAGCCDGHSGEETPDHELPMSHGGVEP